MNIYCESFTIRSISNAFIKLSWSTLRFPSRFSSNIWDIYIYLNLSFLLLNADKILQLQDLVFEDLEALFILRFLFLYVFLNDHNSFLQDLFLLRLFPIDTILDVIPFIS